MILALFSKNKMDVLELPRPVINFLRTMSKEMHRYFLCWDIYGGNENVTLTLTWKLQQQVMQQHSQQQSHTSNSLPSQSTESDDYEETDNEVAHNSNNEAVNSSYTTRNPSYRSNLSSNSFKQTNNTNNNNINSKRFQHSKLDSFTVKPTNPIGGSQLNENYYALNPKSHQNYHRNLSAESRSHLIDSSNNEFIHNTQNQQDNMRQQMPFDHKSRRVVQNRADCAKCYTHQPQSFITDLNNDCRSSRKCKQNGLLSSSSKPSSQPGYRGKSLESCMHEGCNQSSTKHDNNNNTSNLVSSVQRCANNGCRRQHSIIHQTTVMPVISTTTSSSIPISIQTSTSKQMHNDNDVNRDESGNNENPWIKRGDMMDNHPFKHVKTGITSAFIPTLSAGDKDGGTVLNIVEKSSSGNHNGGLSIVSSSSANVNNKNNSNGIGSMSNNNNKVTFDSKLEYI